MIDAISSGLAPVDFVSAIPSAPVAPAAGPDFAVTLDAAVSRVDGAMKHGDNALSALASGGDVDLHGAMIALEEAEIALRALITVRDKAMNAYEQLMNLPV